MAIWRPTQNGTLLGIENGMIFKKKKVSARRQRVRDNITAERVSRLSQFLNSTMPLAISIVVGFIVAVTLTLSLEVTDTYNLVWKSADQIFSLAMLITLVCFAASLYVYHYQRRVTRRPVRIIALAGLFLILLMLTRIGSLKDTLMYLATGSAVAVAIVLTIAYDQRFALGMTLFYCIFACFAATGTTASIELFITMMSGAIACCFSLKEIRKRMKLIEVSVMATLTVFTVTMVLGVIRAQENLNAVTFNALWAAGVTFLVIGVVIQGFLPLIERVFGIATSMTLLDYSDANQPLLKKLAMEAPGTFSHSLLIGSIAEAAADAIGANGLLCRVGAYYHDIGKINKPPYFTENQMGSANRHEQLSPTMSQLVIVGHVKDGIEIAKEYNLPTVLRQFIETHHGTTLIEYFYDQAKKQQGEKDKPVSDSEFRYPGPKPKSKEAAILMLADTSESAARSVSDLTPARAELIVHNMAMKRLQDGQFDECDLTLKELGIIEMSIAKTIAAHHHGRIAYPKSPEEPVKATKEIAQPNQQENQQETTANTEPAENNG